MTNYSPRSVLSFTPTTCGVVHFDQKITTPDKGKVTTRRSYPLIGWAVIVSSAKHQRNGDRQLERVHNTRLAPVVAGDNGKPWGVVEELDLQIDPLAPWSSLATAETPST